MHKALHVPDGLDITRPSPARIYDYMLGGGQYFDADAQAAERILSAVPEIRDTAWANRGYHQRVATWIARQGVRQFLDVGCGLPAEVARFFDGLEIVPPYPGARPGLTCSGVWGAEDPELADSEGSRWLYGGVARIP